LRAQRDEYSVGTAEFARGVGEEERTCATRFKGAT
jgi:hypothetical protein